MPPSTASPSRAGRPRARWFAQLVALLLVSADLGDACAAPNFSLGAKEVIYSASQRKSKLKSWPDGNFGVLANGDGTYDFYAANSSTPMRTTGTLTNPAQSKKKVSIYNVPRKSYSYVAGGPVYQDEASGARFMVYHAEKHFGNKYSSVLGLAASTDPNGLAFYDLGTIIEPNIPVGQSKWSVDVGGGSFAVLDGQFHVYYRDYLADGSSSELAVARAPLADLVSNSLNGIATPFTKYYNGGWSEPGRRGKSSPLEIGNQANWWSSVSYNDYLDELVLVTSQWQSGGTGPDLHLITSPDGVNWSPRQPLGLEPGEQMYPTIIGTGADPQVTGQSFYVYYTHGKRWNGAQLARRQITFDSIGLPVVPPLPRPIDPPGVPPILPPTPGPEPEPTDWALIGDYKDEFQTTAPAAGWTYAWNPSGRLGDADSFSPLLWSDAAQAYNTTGGATQVPSNKRSHIDDFLHLSGGGGHPGKPGYMPIAGYTIQSDDGDGLYRIADSSIQKIDGIQSAQEDGLGVLVYLNDTLLSPAASVSTNGLLTNFDRELGQLTVGDTIWVLVDPRNTHFYDSFKGFDFSIQRAVAQMALMAAVVPEPGTASLLLTALIACRLCRSRRAQR